MREPDDFLSLDELADELRLDRRTVMAEAANLGGRQFGNRWRFRWGTVMESFDAKFTQRQRQRLVGEGDSERQADSVPDVPARQERRPGMEGRKRLGGRNTKSGGGKPSADPYGLRAALGVG
ncbi:MAG: hypothetical protein LBV80_00515 [Deltaproteobacteria bacterium]|nr:hypothetical protein [Deltaproteobacteria bacterium]